MRGCSSTEGLLEQIDEVFKVVPQQRRKRVFMDLVPPYPVLRRGRPCTGKVFTVNVPYHRGDQACAVDT